MVNRCGRGLVYARTVCERLRLAASIASGCASKRLPVRSQARGVAVIQAGGKGAARPCRLEFKGVAAAGIALKAVAIWN